jgi:hypothetical protein
MLARRETVVFCSARVIAVLAVATFALTACEGPGPAAPPDAPTPSSDPAPAAEMSFVETTSEPFGTFDGVAFVRHTGMFEGETSLGAFRVPFEIVAPEDPGLGNGTVLVEPPHFGFGPIGRDQVLGRSFLFERGFSYAAVGFGDFGFNILDPTASELMLAGEPVADPGSTDDPEGQKLDEEILVQFTRALTAEPFATDLLGPIERRYSYGVSQTSAVTLNLLLGPEAKGLFDFNLLHLRFWPEPEELEDEVFPRTSGDFVPPSGVGKIMFVQSESELIRTDAEHFRVAVGNPDYRVYEMAGAPHFPEPPPQNPLETSPVVRAAFMAADKWVRLGGAPPQSAILESAPPGQIDPVYGFETGIARDPNLNALGGIRFPDLTVGRAQFIAVDFDLDAGSRFPGTFGLWVDLACEPEPGSESNEPRFRNHGDYVNRFARQVNELRREGFLLEDDAEALKERAAESEVGKPGSCAD